MIPLTLPPLYQWECTFGHPGVGSLHPEGIILDPMNAQPTDIVLCVAHPTRLQQDIERTPDLQCVATAANIEAAQATIDSLEFDLLIVSLELVGQPTFELIQRAHTQSDVLVLSAPRDKGDVLQALQAGARGFLPDNTPWPLVVEAIAHLQDGAAPIHPRAAGYLLDVAYMSRDRKTARLSARETSVLIALAQGLTYEETASETGISTNTVRYHVKQIYAKLSVSSRAAAVYKANQLGLFSIHSV
ncbi:MAG: response regulator transcription factor [Pseudomonadota bacterium]